jgi:hypothetical protein
MKYLNLSLLILWLCLLGLAIYWAWQSFDNMEVIAGGGYLYDDNGEVNGMWDRWQKADYPHWMFGIAFPVILLFNMPVWWMIPFWSLTAYWAFWIYANRPCIAP